MDNTRKLAVITFFANLYFYNHIGALYLQTRGLSLFQINSLWAIIVVSIFVAEVPTGILADKIGRKWSVVMALLLQAVGEFLYFFSEDYAVFVLISILAGIGFAFGSGAREALVYDFLSDEDREANMKKSMGLIGGAYQLAFFIAPLVGGLIVSQLVLERFLLVIFLTACSVTMALLLSISLVEPQTEYQHSEESPFKVLKQGIDEIKNNKNLIWLTLVAIFTSTFSNSLVNLYQPYFAGFQVPPFWIGASLSLGALLAFFLQRNAYWIEVKLGRRGFFFVTVIPGCMYLLLAVVSSSLFLIPVFITAYASLEVKNPLLASYQNQQIKSRHRATVLSLSNMLVMIYVAGMSLVVGKVADYSIPLSFAVIGAVVILSSLVLKTADLPAGLRSRTQD